MLNAEYNEDTEVATGYGHMEVTGDLNKNQFQWMEE